MTERQSKHAAITISWFVNWRDYLALCKPKIIVLIVFTAAVGMFLAVPGMVPLNALIFGNIGIALAASSAAVVNHIVDQRVDAIMMRTKHRPLQKGNITMEGAAIFGLILGLLSMAILIIFVNMLTAVLTLGSLVGYGFVYSMYLKRATPQNIVIGGASGAAPPVLGWTAVTGTLDPNSLILFLIIFAWTPPHFWALAIYRRDEYAKAAIPMLPVTHGVKFTRLHILYYTIVLFLVSLLPFVFLMSGGMYLFGAFFLGAIFLYYAIKMQTDHSDELAMKTFSFSILYLMALFAFLLADHYLTMIIRQIV
ncbi:MAG: protoheme IX farnesyltransferase [Gammaproteobacteria bacterium]|jgi:protoheme IX farnesyltransferase